MINTKHLNFLLIFIISIGKADLSIPTHFSVFQPNGLEIKIFNLGNHLQGWHEYNEWTITQNQENWWVYASGNAGFQLIPSSIRVGIDPEPNLMTSPFSKGIRDRKSVV